MGVLTASKPWPMSPPPNPSDFPGSNPHAVRATVITNYLHETITADQQYTTPPPQPTAQRVQDNNNLPEFMRGLTITDLQRHHLQQQNQRASMMIKPGHHHQPLYETVRPKSTSFDDEFQLLKPSPSCTRVENDYQIHPLHHYRQRSCESSPTLRRPPVPPPLPPVNPRPAVISSSMDDSYLITRAQAHLYLQAPPTPTCVPWLKKVKVIKNIKRKIGMGGIKSGTSFNNLPPLNFHTVHGENVQIFQEGAVARRINSFCKAIVFSNRSVKVNEKVSIRLIELSNNWSGVLRFGFTNVDPSTLRNCLPKYVCPDLTSRPGFWAKAFSDHLVRKDAILNFHVNSGGEIHFSIDGEDKGIFLSGIDTRLPLWAVMDIYGNTTAVELVDSRAHLNNSRKSLQSEQASSPVCGAKFQDTYPTSPSRSQHIPLKVFQPLPTQSQCQQPENSSPYQRIPTCASARSLPDSQLYSSGCNTGRAVAASKPTMSTSYLPVPHKADHASSSRTTCQPSPPIGCGASSSSSSSFSRPQLLPVYKTPPMPKACKDYYEPIDSLKKMSVKPGPSTMSNYVSISSLKVRADCSPKSSSSNGGNVSQAPAATTTCSPPKDSPAMSLECLACCERPVDSVFYSCGHMCMCYECAVVYWRTKEKGHCPICRSAINDVIRTYT